AEESTGYATFLQLLRPRLLTVSPTTPDGHGVLCLPLAPGNRVSDFDLTARWMYYGTFHARPMVNGYSGFFPRSYFKLRSEIGNKFPDADMVNRLRELRVSFVVVLRSMFPDVPDAEALADSGVEHVLSTPAKINR
ncbi:MAG: hypothetical protein O2945_16745, partial [Planctomycetota bacterium]|nr:hypothetical protein [Planctomycetota bacterium]